MKPCLKCKSRPRISEHHNAKWCAVCRKYLLSRPAGTMTREQRIEAKSLIGKMDRREIAEHLGVSLANLKRSLRGVRLAFHNHLYANPELVKDVCRYYEKHGRKKTEKQFPDVKVRSIVERYKQFKPRQIRWTNEQIIELAKMSGLVSMTDQAKHFNRPRARAGSIQSFWMKRMGFGGGSIHGLSKHIAKQIATKDCPYIKTRFWQTRRGRADFSRHIALWVDLNSHLKSDVPDFIKEAIGTMADFQVWLFETSNPRMAILNTIKSRSQKGSR